MNVMRSLVSGRIILFSVGNIWNSCGIHRMHCWFSKLRPTFYCDGKFVLRTSKNPKYLKSKVIACVNNGMLHHS